MTSDNLAKHVPGTACVFGTLLGIGANRGQTQGVYKDFSGLRLKPSWVLSPCGVMDFSFHIHCVSAISKECLSWHFSFKGRGNQTKV
jgi:hypothetical protein